MALYNLARVTTTTTGTGTITLGAAVDGFKDFATAGVTDGQVVTYSVRDGNNSEVGRGTYTASGTTLTRTVLSSTNSNNPIDLSGSAEVIITAAAEDFPLRNLGSSADKFPYTSGADAWTEGTITSFGRSLVDDADAAAGRATLGAMEAAASSTDGEIVLFDGTSGASAKRSNSLTGMLKSSSGVAAVASRATDYVAPISGIVYADDYTVNDGVRLVATASITSGAAVLTATGASFASGDVGKQIYVSGAGTGGAPLVTTIAGYTSATQVTLTANAATTLSAVSTVIYYGSDETSALNTAMAAVPADGGILLISPGVHMYTGLALGDGTSSIVSTKNGVRVMGAAAAPQVNGAGGTKLIYCGTVSGTAVAVYGPLQGFEVSNLYIDGAERADYGLRIISASMGQTHNLSFKGCRVVGYATDCYGTHPISVPLNTELIKGSNINIVIPAVANSGGLSFRGPSSGTTSSCFIDLSTIRVYPTSSVANYPVIFQVCDTVKLNNLLIFHNATANASTYNVLYDYSANDTFPSGCVIESADVGWNCPAGQQFANSGTPGTWAKPNRLITLSELNGGVTPSGIANLRTDLPSALSERVNLTGLTTALVGTTVTTVRTAGLYRINYYAKMTTAGSAGTIQLQVGYNDGAGAGIVCGTLTATTLNDHIGGTTTIYCIAASTIVVVTPFTGVTGSPVYEVRVSVEQVGVS